MGPDSQSTPSQFSICFFLGFLVVFFSTDGLGMGDCLEMVPRDYPNLSKSILLFKLIGLGFCQVKNIVEPPEFLYIFDHVCVLSTPLDWRKSKINSFLKTILFFLFEVIGDGALSFHPGKLPQHSSP